MSSDARFRVATLTLVALVAFGFPGCKKKPEAETPTTAEAKDPGASVGRQTGHRSRARPAGEVSSAAAACAKGARPDRTVTEDQYELSVRVPSETPVGETAQAEIVVLPRSGFKINLKYPAELTMKAGSPGLELPKRELDKSQAKELNAERLRFQVPFSATTAGRKVVHGELGFSVCTPKVCITEPDMCVAWEVTAK